MAYDRSNSGSVIQGPMSVSKRDSYETEMINNKQIPYRISRTSKGYFAANAAASPGDLRAIAVYFSGWNWSGSSKSSSPLNVCWYPYLLNLDANGGEFEDKSTLISGKKMFQPILNRNGNNDSNRSTSGKDIGTASNCVVDGEKKTKPYAVIPKRDGWQFEGWSDSPDSSKKISTFGGLITNEEILKGQICYKVFSTSSASSASGNPADIAIESIVGEGTATLYAKWTQKTYTVKIKYPVIPDGWRTNTATTNFTYGKELPNPPAGTLNPKCTGYIFKGIYSEENGNGTCYYDENMKPKIDTYDGSGIINDILKLYAHYVPINYSVVFRVNVPYGSGTLPEPINLNYDEYAVIPELSDYHIDGYTFTYWANSTDLTDGKKYYPGDEFVNLTAENGKTITMTAQWHVNSYSLKYIFKDSVIFENNGEGDLNPEGTTSPDRYTELRDVKVPYGTSCIVTDYEPMIFGYDFLGWKLYENETDPIDGEVRFLRPGEVFPWNYDHNMVAKPVFVVSPTICVCEESIMVPGKTFYRCLLYEDITDDDIVLTKEVSGELETLTLGIDYTYEVLKEHELEINLLADTNTYWANSTDFTDKDKIHIELFNNKNSWHRGIPYICTESTWNRGNLYFNKEGKFVR